MSFDRQSNRRLVDATRKSEDDPIRPRMYPIQVDNKTPVLVRVSANGGGGYYTVTVARHHNIATAAYQPKRVSPVTNNFITQVYDINGVESIPVGAVTLAYPVFASDSSSVESDSGEVKWVINWGTYGVQTGGGAWVEITGGTNPYSWKQKDPDATTDTTPAITGTNNLYEVNGRDGIPTGSVVWVWCDAVGDTYRCEYHGADDGTRYDVLAGSGEAAQTDTWDRADQGTDRGVEVQFVTRLVVNSSDEMYAFCRDAYYDANGHLDFVTAETKKLVGTLAPGTVSCGTGMEPDDPSISSDLIGWWKADAITGLSDGNSVTTWADSSGNGNSLTQSTSAAKPTYKTNIYNGLPTVRFDGTDDWIGRAALMTAPFTLFVVAKQTSGNGAVVSNYDFTATNEYGFEFRHLSSTVTWLEIDGTYPSGTLQFSGGSSTSLYAACAVRRSDSDREIFLNGASSATNTTTANISFAGSNIEYVFGAQQNSSVPNKGFFMNGDICEVCYYDAQLSDSQIEQVSCHLKAKWGI